MTKYVDMETILKQMEYYDGMPEIAKEVYESPDFMFAKNMLVSIVVAVRKLEQQVRDLEEQVAILSDSYYGYED